jgi:hypothetical protein
MNEWKNAGDPIQSQNTLKTPEQAAEERRKDKQFAAFLLSTQNFKTPEQAAQERRKGKLFWPRFFVLAVLSLVLSFFTCGLLGILDNAAFWAVAGLWMFGLCAFLLF